MGQTFLSASSAAFFPAGKDVCPHLGEKCGLTVGYCREES